jgi:ATP-dependent Clp protease ATP-binding subunit ClpC
MTSNLGTRDLAKGSGLGFSKADKKTLREKMEEKIQEELKKAFNPEFMNRLDETVIFNPLDRKEIIQIVDIELKEILSRIKERGITAAITPGAKALIAENGYDPTFGARHLKRIIQKMVEDPLAEEILQGKFGDGSKIRITKKGDGLNFNDGGSTEEEPVDQEVVEKDKA